MEKDPSEAARRIEEARQLRADTLVERAQTERALLIRLVQGEREIAAEHGFDLDEVLAEADTLLIHNPD